MAGFLKLSTDSTVDELMEANSLAFLLITQIARRARRRMGGLNPHGLDIGEALIGDHATIGLTMREYRTAKGNLEKWKLATFRTTNKGTIAKLTGSTIYDINAEADDNQTDRPGDKRPTSRRQATDKQATTNEEGKEGKKDKKAAASAAAAVSTEEWLASLRAEPAYAHCDIDTEAAKMRRWCAENNKQEGRKRFINWLNRIDKPTTPNGKTPTHPNRPAGRNAGTANESRPNQYDGIGRVPNSGGVQPRV